MKQFLPALACAAIASAALGTPANAATLLVDLVDVYSYSYLGSADNVAKWFNLGAGAHVTGFAYSVTLDAYEPSFLSELSLLASNTAGTTGFYFTPAEGDNFSGALYYTGSFDLVANGADIVTDADGLLWLDFFESYVDFDDTPDGVWNGTLTFTYTPGTPTGGTDVVPEPAAWAMMIAGFGLVGASLRRRRQSIASLSA